MQSNQAFIFGATSSCFMRYAWNHRDFVSFCRPYRPCPKGTFQIHGPLMLKNLSYRQKAYLRSVAARLQLSNELKILTCYEDSEPEMFILSVRDALDEHELVKIRMNNVLGKKKEVKEAAKNIAEAMSSDTDVVLIIGKTAVLYRKNFKNPKIPLEEAELPKPGKRLTEYWGD